MGADLGIFSSILGGLAGGAEIQQIQRAGTEQKRFARKEAGVLRERADEETGLLRIRARRQAAASRARLGAAGVRGTPLLVVQESLLLAFDEQNRIQSSASQRAFSIGRRGRRAASASRAQAFIRGTQLLSSGVRQAAGIVGGGV